MDDKDPFKTIASMTLEGGSASMSFPTPKEHEPFVHAVEHVYLSIDYYLLARFAFLHRMHSAFMVNSFWAVEHLVLSILALHGESKEGLRELGGFHEIGKYWMKAKALLPGDMASLMDGFDDYVGKVRGYYSERYPKPVPKKCKLMHTSKIPRVVVGDDEDGPTHKFGKVVPLSLDELDHFVNFMLHDITVFSKGCSVNLMTRLASQKNEGLYSQDNEYSVVHPNKKYHGERGEA